MLIIIECNKQCPKKYFLSCKQSFNIFNVMQWDIPSEARNDRA